MDEFGWGNTRLVVGEGNNKKVMISEDEKFDESMIPLKKFSGIVTVFFFDDGSNLMLLYRIRSRGLGNRFPSFG
jgi:hypothetical protein